MLLEIKKTTRRVRKLAAGTCLRILTPKFYEVVSDTFACARDKFPRPSTRIIHKTYGERPLVGVEIGTGFGENALSLLHELNIQKLYCIDPFVPYLDGDTKIQTDYLSRSEHTVKMLSKFENVTFVKKLSSEAREEVPENVDFVYIDGNHGYDYVLADLRDYYPLVREKGVIGGHDPYWSSVRKALTDFCRENIIKPLVVPPDWIIIK
jgi:hypothetical protein